MDQPKELRSSTAIGSLTLSTSVLKVGQAFGSDEKINAWDIVKRLFALHLEYAGGKGIELIRLSHSPYESTREPVSFSEWIRAIGTIIDKDYVEFLDGRLVILGLCLFEEGLKQFLLERDIIGALLSELGKPFYSFLTIRARLDLAGKSWADLPQYQSLMTPQPAVHGSAESRQEGGTTVPPLPDLEGLNLSDSVRNVAIQMDPTSDVNPGEIVQQLLKNHPEYGGGKAAIFASVDLAERDFRMERVADWLSEVRSLFKKEVAPQLHGRLVILGICLLCQGLRDRLLQDDFLGSLEDELQEPLKSLLTHEGYE